MAAHWGIPPNDPGPDFVPAEATPVCCIKKCKFKNSQHQMQPCGGGLICCQKHIHHFCYATEVFTKYGLAPLQDTVLNDTYCSCSQWCHKKILTA
jgi:hypothetical protein